ncbi:LptF/LptG family permease [Pseudodesulfovibrio tunisiensis]|uniref:LptF/LptG family permease n=1 Tax=Pseudodesulfovibrio tunisiensis TaxID=463192 RepID=UPI001FB47A0E|nr:LptF/LptG family permease [Pseudodesulfovibrio tunisiensis]
MRFGVLSRYLLRQNMYYMLICLCCGACLYLLSDVFDRLDNFVQAEVGTETIFFYFLVKIPLIISQLMPAIFVLAMVIQLGILSRSKEMLALRAGGVSWTWFIMFFVWYGLFWSGVQFGFSQVVGVYGEHEANRIWKEEVRKRQLDELRIKHLWFRDGPFVVHAEEAQPSKSRATGVTVYEFATDSERLIRIISAKKALVDDNGWGLLDVHELDTRTFRAAERLSQFLSVRQNLESFSAVKLSNDKAQLPLWELGDVIGNLKVSGANVNQLETVWHSRFAYAFSVCVMALLALALSTVSDNLFLNIGLALALVFVHYGFHVVGVSAGQQGTVPPVLGAWFGNMVMGGLAVLRLAWVSVPGLADSVKNWLAGLRFGRV